VRIETLERHGIPGEVIKRWRKSGLKHLLPIQAESVNRYGLLRGQSLIINAPGTSGKTFCGEMAALRAASLGQRAVFLVPLKAIAEEKYRTFKERYASLGIRVSLATRDHTDRGVAGGDFGLLVTIYEKFNAITAADPSLIRNVGCFVIDEFQLISDPERGAELEILMAKIRAFNPSAQLVILVGEGAFPADISGWLKVPVFEENRRPVDLRLGVLHRGTFHYRGFNDFREGEEMWLADRSVDIEAQVDNQVMDAVESLARKGEQIILFCASRKKCPDVALAFAGKLGLPPASSCIKRLDDLPPSIQNERLARCLYGGVAFHHAELDSDQRRLVEDGFRAGEILILVSTSTLASGVNLPAKNVFIDMMKYDGVGSPNRRAMRVPISLTDFRQAAGRAGRLGSGDGFGRAVMAASTPYEHEILWDRYVYSRENDNSSDSNHCITPELCLRLIVCGAANSIDELRSDIAHLFCMRDGRCDDELSKTMMTALDFLQTENFIRIGKSGNIEPTMLGGLTCTQSLSPETASRIMAAAGEREIREPYDWLFFILGSREWRQRAGFYKATNINEEGLCRSLCELTDGIFENSSYLSAKWRMRKLPEIQKRLIHMLFILEWIDGTPTRDIEILFDRGSGGLRRDTETLVWLVSGLETILRYAGIDEAEVLQLQEHSLRVKYGVNETMLPLARLLGIDREFIRRLWDNGIKSVNDLYEVDHQTFNGLLPDPMIRVIQKHVAGVNKYKIEKETRPVLPGRICFTGAVRNRIKEVIIDGKSVFLQEKMYSYLRKLWHGLNSEDPWVHKENLETGFNQAKYISKLRKQLAKAGIEVDIESNGNGFYRLLLPESVKGTGVGRDNQKVGVDRG